MSSISFESFLQNYPFTIVSWTTQRFNTILDLIITPRRDLIRKLYVSAEKSVESFAEQSIDQSKTLSKNNKSLPYNPHGSQLGADDESSQELLEKDANKNLLLMFGYKNVWNEFQRSDFRLALFSESYRRGISVGDYNKVLIIATDSGIVAQLSYLQELVSGFNSYRVRTRDIHLVWQLHCIGTRYLLQPFLTDASADDRRPASKLIDRILKDDTNSNSYVNSYPKTEILSF